MFRNLFLYRFDPDTAKDLERLPYTLGDRSLRDIGTLELHNSGFVPPMGRVDEAELTRSASGCTLLTLGYNEKILPATVVNDALAKKVRAIVAQEDRKVGGRERKRLRDDLITELLARAFVRTGRVSAYVDIEAGWLVIDSASRKAAESLVTNMREALGSFPVRPLAPEESPRVLMTDWLASGKMPNSFTLGDECELRDPATSTGALAKCSRQELDSDEVKEHLRNGKQVFKLGLVFDDRISFVLGEDLVLRKFKFLDLAMDELPEQFDDAEAEMDARFTHLTLELRVLLGRLETIFGLHIDAPLHLHKQDVPAWERLNRMAAENGGATLHGSDGELIAEFGITGKEYPLLDRAIQIVRDNDACSISMLQRFLKTGYIAAARLIECMEQAGVVSAPDSAGKRTVLSATTS